MPDSAYSLLFSSGNQETQTPSTEGSVTAPVPTPTSGSSAFGLLFGGSSPESPLSGQDVGVSAPAQHLYQDSTQPWYKRAWDWANTPVTESLFGWPEDRPGAGGFERGVEHIASGLASPLSLALTAATFGTGGVIESAGMTALKESGEFTAEQLPQITKAAQTALDAFKAQKDIEPVIKDAVEAGGHNLDLLQRAREAVSPFNRDAELAEPRLQSYLSKVGLNPKQKEAFAEGKLSAEDRQAIATANGGFSDDELKALSQTGNTIRQATVNFKPIEDSIREAGVDPDLWKKAQDVLYKNGLTEQDLLGGDLVRRGAFQVLRTIAPELPIAATARAAKTAEAVLTAGFTLQQVESAAAMSPRFFDALKEGDYDKALEYGTEAAISGGLGVLGASHALHSAGELFQPLIETNKFRPNDEWLAVDRANKEKEALYAVAEQHGVNIDKVRYEVLGHQKPGVFGLPKDVKARQDLELASVLNHVISGGDTEKAGWVNSALEQAAGRTEVSPLPRPNNGLLPNSDVQDLAQKYVSAVGIDKPAHEGLVAVDPEAAKRVADAYQEMQHNPGDPKVKASYDALIRETKAQWDAAKAAGYTFEPWTKPGQPYADSDSPSRAMAEDVRNNKHLFYFTGGELPENHPLSQVDPGTGETYNNIFRAVHDLFGHAKNGYEFGPRGEENAFLAHSRMYSDEAIPALMSETKGQNSWTNFGPHLRDENGNLPKKGEKGYIPPPQRPFAENKAGLLPPELVNPHLANAPLIGQPIETPSRVKTQVIHSNDSGEVRVGADGRPIVWLGPEAWQEFQSAVSPKNRFAGVSFSPKETLQALAELPEKGPRTSQIVDLFDKARNASKQRLTTAARTPATETENEAAISVAAEELHHTWQRELAQNGEILNHLDGASRLRDGTISVKPGSQWSRLSAIIPKTWLGELDSLGYDKDPVTQVAETAAQFRSGKAKGIVSDTDITRFLDAYYTEVVAKHGPKALDTLEHINDVARQHVEDINARREQAARTTNEETGNRQLSGLETGRETRTPEVGPREPQTGLEAREPDEFDKLSGLKLRVGMGDPGSAALVTGDNDVLVGRDHAELIRKAGYKASPATNKPGEDLYAKFFKDGGVRIRMAGGTAHVDFMEPNAGTWDRVYRSVASIPDASKYYVDFRPVKGGTGFNISAYDKDNLLYRLKDLEEGRETPAPVGSVSYFRRGLMARGPEEEYRKSQENTPEFRTWFGDSKVVDEEGRPLQVYHGTKENFDTFKDAEKRKYGHYFTEDPEYAAEYAGDRVGANVIPSYLRLENPVPYERFVETVRASHKTGSDPIRELQKQGYDGVITTKGHEFGLPGLADKKTYIAFSPEQIKSSIGNRGTFQRGNPNILFSRYRENLAPTWYLKSNQLIDSRMQGPMPADTVLKMLENNGVKPDELKYTGLQDFLKDKGKEPVRPEELRSYLAANNLQVQEVTHGGSQPGSSEAERIRDAFDSATDSFRNRLRTVFGEDKAESLIDKLDSRAARGLTEDEAVADFSGEFKQQARELFRLNNQVNSLPWEESTNKTRKNPETKFDSYTLPGAIPGSYREFVLSLPRQTAYERDNLGQPPREEFQSSHFPEIPNPVGHVRFNDRTGPNGEKLLHLEELQSDWHQTGRTEGYKAGEEATRELLRKQGWSVEKVESTKWNPETRGNELIVLGWRAKLLPGTQMGPMETNEEAAWRSVSRERDSGVPDAPFKKTDEWTGLLFKRMIRYAAEHGYDGISWTPGVEHFNRWGSERFDWEKQGEGKWSVSGKSQHGGNAGGIDLEGEADRRGLLTKSREDVRNQGDLRRIVHRTMEDTSSKEKIDALTKKLWDRMQSEDSGTSMPRKEGFESYYDQITPQVANKLGKQFGAKVQSTKIEAGKYPLDESWKPEQARIIKQGEQIQVWAPNANGVDQFKANFSTREAAEKYIADHEPGYKEAKKVPYLPITDSMRESVLKQGQPLFARSPNNGLPDNIDEMIKSNVFKNQPKEYQDLILNSWKRVASGELSDKELKASKYLQNEQDKNFEIGNANDILHHYLEDYMTRVYKDANPSGKVILSNAKSGKFATNVTMAKHRVYDSNLTALLKSPKPMSMDPVDITARGRVMLIKAAANKQLIDTLRDKFTRASDGRPAVVLSGRGQVVSGQNGEDPKTFIDPNRVRKINIDPKVVDQLTKSGDLQRYLDEGTIRDITPYIRPDNIGGAIDRLEQQAGRQEANYDEVGNNKLRTDIMLLKSMQNNSDFRGLKDFNDKLEKKYAWDPQDYISLSDHALKGWNFVTNDSAGNNVFVHSDIRVHPEFAEYLQNRLGLETSGISKNPIGKALLGAGTRLKQTLLSLSPFHMVQEALRAVMVGVNPFHITGPDILSGEKVNPEDPNSPTIIKKATEHGFTPGTDHHALQEHSEGLSSGGGGLISKIPGVGKVLSNSLDWYQNFLFNRYIPALKARSVELMYHEYQRLHPEWSVDHIAKAAAQHTNDTFGGVNWRALGRSATTQDWGRLLLLAPDWLESEMRSGVRLFNREEGGLGRAQVAKMALGLWGVSRVLNLLTTGNAHYEAPFGLAVKNKEGKETVFGIRTLPSDLLHAASDPVGFIKGRLSPTIRAGEELTTGRDQYGRKMQPQDLFVDVFRNMAPIPLQSIGQALSGSGPEVGNVGQGWKAVGGTAQTYSSPAQKFAADEASTHSEDGPLDPVAMARHRQVLRLEDQVRAGELSWPDLYKLTYQTDQLKESELKKIQDNIKQTHGMTPDMALLYSRASRLPANEYLQLLDMSNPSERTALVPLTIKVQKRYLTKAKKDETPEERSKDPVFQKFIRMIPGSTQEAPQPQSYVAPIIPPTVQKEVAYLYTATHPQTGHRVGSNDGQTWYDHQTGVPVNG